MKSAVAVWNCTAPMAAPCVLVGRMIQTIGRFLSRIGTRLRFFNDVHKSQPFSSAFDHNTQDKANAAGIKLVLNIARLQLGALLRQKTVFERAKRNRGRFMQTQYSCLILSKRRCQFLEIVIVNLWMRLHDNPGLRSIHPSPPRSLGAYHVAFFIKFCGILPEIPDVSIPVLCEIVKSILSQDATHKNSVVDYSTNYSVDDYRSVCNSEHISFLT